MTGRLHEILLTLAAFALLLSWIIYPLLMATFAFLGQGRSRATRPAPPTASVVIATRDDVKAIALRIGNIESYRSELERVEIIVALDRAANLDTKAYRDFIGDRARIVEGDPPGGKAATLNAGVRAASESVVIFADSSQAFLAGTLGNLARAVLQPGVGVVTGQISQLDTPNGLVMRIFWAYEHWLRRTESSVDSVVGVTGAIYAIRRLLWTPLPSGLIDDDVFVPLWITSLGYRAVTCDAAYAIDPRAFTPRQEFRRRVRTLTGILQLVRVRPAILNPFANRLWLQFLCHKLLRFCTPFWIVIALLVLLSDMTTRQITLIILALAALLTAAVLAPRPSLISRTLRQLGMATLVLLAPFVATANALRGNWNVWDNSKPGAQ